MKFVFQRVEHATERGICGTKWLASPLKDVWCGRTCSLTGLRWIGDSNAVVAYVSIPTRIFLEWGEERWRRLARYMLHPTWEGHQARKAELRRLGAAARVLTLVNQC